MRFKIIDGKQTRLSPSKNDRWTMHEIRQEKYYLQGCIIECYDEDELIDTLKIDDIF